MAIIGGAGNPVGGSFTGPAEALEILGNHAYAMSGSFVSAGGDSADTTYLKFTSGNYYFVGTVGVYEKNSGGSAARYMDTTFNGVSIMQLKSDGNPDWLNNFPIPIIIPSYTDVEVKCGINLGEIFSVVLVGRIYRAND